MTLFDDLIRVGIVGSRRRDSEEAYFAIRGAFMALYVPDRTVIISGGCPKGGDKFAEMIAAELGMPRDCRWSGIRKTPEGAVLPDLEGQRIVIHYPDHEAFAEVPSRWRSTRANYHRNGLIARDSTEALIAALGATRGGTDDTVAKFEKFHGKKAILV